MTIQAHNIETLMNLHAETVHYAIELQKETGYSDYKRNDEAMHNANDRFYSFAKSLMEGVK